MEPGLLEALLATFGPDTWQIYDHLDTSLAPTGPDELFDNGLTDPDRALLAHHRGVVSENLDRAQPTPRYAGVRRGRAPPRADDRDRHPLATAYGADVLAHVEANLHWELWQFLGLTLPVVHVLRREQ